MTATAISGQCLLIRRLISRPDSCTFYLCWAPPGRPATMTCFITIAGRRWPAEESFKTGKDVLGWDQSQARTWDSVCRHTALAALAQLRAAAIRSALTGRITLPAASPGDDQVGATRSATAAALTCRYPSATRPCRPAAGSPARPPSPPSSCPSPRPPGPPPSPGSTPPG